MKRTKAEEQLHRLFKLDHFYDNQWKTIENLLQGKRILLIEKTGFGKSLCYQFPAVMFQGLTVVFSPLIALMRDQVQKLKSLGIPAECINSEQSYQEQSKILEQARNGTLKILYIAPERQESRDWQETVEKLNLSMVVIDEAHCISVWGHDFRPAFRRIIDLIKPLPPDFPVLATTATATKRVAQDILRQMGGNITLIRGDLFRRNFQLSVVRVNSEEEKMAWLVAFLKKQKGSGIIYTGTRINTDVYASWLQFSGINAANYNAGLSAQIRKEIEKGLHANRWKCIVSTVALGMGIDKPDIRFIVHTQIPQSPIHYYQEIGRAGRNDLPTNVFLLYNPADRELPEHFIQISRPSLNSYNRVINTLRKKPLTYFELMRNTNLPEKQIKVITADLIDQGIIFKNNKIYEYLPGAGQVDMNPFEEMRTFKLKELEHMLTYTGIQSCRMDYLCRYLGDSRIRRCGKCDNDLGRSHTVSIPESMKRRIEQFNETYLPVLKVESKDSNIVNGIAAGYYGFSQIGSIIHRCKYENGGDFSDYIVKKTVKAFKRWFGGDKFDMLLYVPPTESGNLVRNFAVKLSKILEIPISHDLKKVTRTKPQKIFQNYFLKRENVFGAFAFEKSKDLKGKSVLLIDDIFDSGSTIVEIGKLLTDLGTSVIAPVVIAKTVGGSWDNSLTSSDIQKTVPEINKELEETDIYEILRRWREQKARKLSLSLYCIVSNAALRNIADASPKSLRELLEIKGIGPITGEKFGDEILKLINKDYVPGNDISDIERLKKYEIGKEEYDRKLYEILKKWVQQKSKELSLPTFMIFRKDTLKNIAGAKPATMTALLRIKGIGKKKAEKFGREVLSLINKDIIKKPGDSTKNFKIPDYIKKTRKTYPNAYKPWTVEDDNKLLILYKKRTGIKELAKIFERKEGAINSRIKRLLAAGNTSKEHS